MSSLSEYERAQRGPRPVGTAEQPPEVNASGSCSHFGCGLQVAGWRLAKLNPHRPRRWLPSCGFHLCQPGVQLSARCYNRAVAGEMAGEMSGGVHGG